MKSKRSKATDIPQKVKMAVWERDGHKCVICDSATAMPNAHYIPRSKGGLGIEENVVTLCFECHYMYDFGSKAQRKGLGYQIKGYLMSQYPEWDEDKLIYRKWS